MSGFCNAIQDFINCIECHLINDFDFSNFSLKQKFFDCVVERREIKDNNWMLKKWKLFIDKAYKHEFPKSKVSLYDI